VQIVVGEQVIDVVFTEVVWGLKKHINLFFEYAALPASQGSLSATFATHKNSLVFLKKKSKKNMGAASSRNVTETMMKSITNVTTEMLQQIDLKTAQSQAIVVKGGTGDVKIDGNVQRLMVTLQLDGILSAISTQEAKQKLVTQITQQTKASVTGALNFGQFASATNITKNAVESFINMATSIAQQCAADSKQTQAIVVEQRNGKVEITNNLQDAIGNLFSRCVYDAVSQNAALQELQLVIDQSASAEAKGLSDWALVALAFIGLLAVVLPIAIPLAVATSTIVKILIPLFGIALVVGGLVFVIMYYTSATDMIAVPYSKGIATYSGECSATPLGGLRYEFATPALAADSCNGFAECQGFDWKGSDTTAVPLKVLDPPETQFYSKVKPLCGAVVANPDPKPDMVLKTMLVNVSDRPPIDGSDVATDPTMWVNKNTGEYWVYTPSIGWEFPYEEKLFPGVSANVQVLYGTSDPDRTKGKDGDLYLDVRSFDTIKVYTKVQGAWGVPDLREGPGPQASIPPFVNMSGFKVKLKPSWYEWLGWTLFALGLFVFIAFAIFTIFSPKNKVVVAKEPPKAAPKAEG
jgi:hypothetical protein